MAQQTPGFSGADLANLINEAAILAARRNEKQIGQDEMLEAIDRLIAGPARKSRVISKHEKEVTAYHEAGHATVGHFMPHADKVHKISIVSRGRIYPLPSRRGTNAPDERPVQGDDRHGHGRARCRRTDLQ